MPFLKLPVACSVQLHHPDPVCHHDEKAGGVHQRYVQAAATTTTTTTPGNTTTTATEWQWTPWTHPGYCHSLYPLVTAMARSRQLISRATAASAPTAPVLHPTSVPLTHTPAPVETVPTAVTELASMWNLVPYTMDTPGGWKDSTLRGHLQACGPFVAAIHVTELLLSSISAAFFSSAPRLSHPLASVHAPLPSPPAVPSIGMVGVVVFGWTTDGWKAAVPWGNFESRGFNGVVVVPWNGLHDVCALGREYDVVMLNDNDNDARRSMSMVRRLRTTLSSNTPPPSVTVSHPQPRPLPTLDDHHIGFYGGKMKRIRRHSAASPPPLTPTTTTTSVSPMHHIAAWFTPERTSLLMQLSVTLVVIVVAIFTLVLTQKATKQQTAAVKPTLA